MFFPTPSIQDLKTVKIYIASFILLVLNDAIAQTNYITENEEYIGWQPGVSFEFKDFKAEPDSNFLKLCSKYDYSTITNIQIYAYLDVPEKKGQRKRKMEEVYIAPVFCKRCSFAKEENLIELRQDQIYFMIAEYAARVGRMSIDSLITQSPRSTGLLTIMFMTLKNDIIEHQRKMNAAYGRDILVYKKPGAYEEWSAKLAELLDETKAYATKPTDCHRIITGKPLTDGYILAPRVIGDQREREY